MNKGGQVVFGRKFREAWEMSAFTFAEHVG